NAFSTVLFDAEPSEAVNMSLGLSMTKDPKSSKIIACGPTIPKNCRVVTTYNGMCFTVDRNSNVEGPIPSALRDIAFLLDGSGSVSEDDFKKMKTFVELMVQGLITRDIRFAVAQYSNQCEIHIDFTYQLNSNLIQNIQQKGGGTYTASAINKLVNDLFIRNARANANRVLVVITDGQSHDANYLSTVAARAQQNKIIRYAIGVGDAFTNENAEKELNTIASDPPSEYIFKVDSFSVLNRIKETLEKNIIAIEGGSVPFLLQIGSYFGAEVCAVDLDVDSFTDLLLVSAPLFTQASKEGIVFVYSSEPIMTLEGMAGQRGRFGSSLASPGDLNGDKITDVVVGAPLEDIGQGSVYIFNGQAGGIASTYSQRISGSSVQSGLRFFGLSLSQNALDQSEDGLLDIAVGSKGTAMLFRSRPIVSLVTTVTYNPRKIPPKETECEKPLENTVTVCFFFFCLDLKAKLNYDLKLDAKRQTFRAFFQDKPKKERVQRGEMVVGLSDACKEHNFLIELDFINYLIYSQLDFEINCGTDNICIDDLKVDFNFSGHSDIQVGIMQEMNVTVFVENRGENSYNPQVTLTYPFGLSYRRFTSKQGRVECVSVDSDQPLALGKTTCYISKPILRQSSFVSQNINCSVATCRRFRCNTNILKRGVELYIISAKVSSGWIEQINTQVEVYEEKNLLKEIIGGVIGGLVLLALITAGLYKAGFFKSQYKQMLEDAGGEQTAAPDGETPEE
uniref:Integrin, alpha M (complement component 3 receptor 3 subunit), tandem duplicate 2 n=1 Tax=Astyanax mexicanus TaxID=7994 RepID=W5LPA5_ASTMX